MHVKIEALNRTYFDFSAISDKSGARLDRSKAHEPADAQNAESRRIMAPRSSGLYRSKGSPA